jgi:hypothetical protein
MQSLLRALGGGSAVAQVASGAEGKGEGKMAVDADESDAGSASGTDEAHAPVRAYAAEVAQREHRVARFALLVLAVPLLSIIFGLPLTMEKQRGKNRLDVVASSDVFSNAVNDPSLVVPRGWLKPFPVAGAGDAPRSCPGFTPRKDLESSPKVRIIRVIGERGSGVEAVADALQGLFPNATVGAGFTRGKFWFQSESLLSMALDDGSGAAAGKKGERKKNKEQTQIDISRVLVVVVLRNPYEWLHQLRRNPLHAPDHVRRKDWRAFVGKPWTTAMSISDKELAAGGRSVKCQARFRAGEVAPCRQSRFSTAGLSADSLRRKRDMLPVYESNPVVGGALRSALELRKYKLLNWANMTKWVPNLTFLRVERLYEPAGVQRLQQVLAQHYNLATCDAAQVEPFQDPQHYERHPLSSNEELDYLTCNLDWDAENLFGYTALAPQTAPEDDPGKDAAYDNEPADAINGAEEEDDDDEASEADADDQDDDVSGDQPDSAASGKPGRRLKALKASPSPPAKKQPEQTTPPPTSTPEVKADRSRPCSADPMDARFAGKSFAPPIKAQPATGRLLLL